jgi:hypothetical protein
MLRRLKAIALLTLAFPSSTLEDLNGNMAQRIDADVPNPKYASLRWTHQHAGFFRAYSHLFVALPRLTSHIEEKVANLKTADGVTNHIGQLCHYYSHHRNRWQALACRDFSSLRLYVSAWSFVCTRICGPHREVAELIDHKVAVILHEQNRSGIESPRVPDGIRSRVSDQIAIHLKIHLSHALPLYMRTPDPHPPLPVGIDGWAVPERINIYFKVVDDL